MTEINPNDAAEGANALSAKPAKTRTSKPAKSANAPKPAKKSKAEAAPAPKRAKVTPKPKEKGPTRLDHIAAFLQRPEGVTVQQLVDDWGIQRHTARAQICMAKDRAGLKVERGKDGVYRAI